MKTYTQLQNITLIEKNKDELREKYIDGRLFSVGDVVIDILNKKLHEVVDLGTNYVSVVNEQGELSEKWITNLIHANQLKEDFNQLCRKRSSKNQLVYAGYRTKNFTPEIYEAFRKTTSDKTIAKIAMINLIRSTDKLLETINNITVDNYTRTKSLLEQTQKYLDKNEKLMYHAYRENFYDQVNLFELSENMTLTSNLSRMVTMISNVFGVDSNNSPTDIINEAAEIFKNQKHSEESWKTAGKLFNSCSNFVSWNKEIFNPTTQKLMGIH
jgi:hypothetical protein